MTGLTPGYHHKDWAAERTDTLWDSLGSELKMQPTTTPYPPPSALSGLAPRIKDDREESLRGEVPGDLATRAMMPHCLSVLASLGENRGLERVSRSPW